MDEPIFARTRYVYQSYSDFWRLVELSGFQTCYVDEVDLEKDQVYVTAPVNGETRPHLHHRRAQLKSPQQARIIVWLLERPDTMGDVNAGVREIMKYVDAVWTSDWWLAETSRKLSEAEGGPSYIYAPMGSHPELSLGPQSDGRGHDIAHLSYAVPRREAIYKPLAAFGCRIAPNAWGDERDGILRSSRAMLNVHQDESRLIEPLRIAVAAAYRLAYLTEECGSLLPLVHDETCLSAPYRELVQSVLSWFKHKDLGQLGERLHQKLCIQTNFREGVLEALSRSFESEAF